MWWGAVSGKSRWTPGDVSTCSTLDEQEPIFTLTETPEEGGGASG